MISDAYKRIPFLVGSLADWPASETPNKTAIETPDACVSFGALYELIHESQKQLRQLGAHRFQRWALFFEPNAASFAHLFALLRLGCAVGLMNARTRRQSLERAVPARMCAAVGPREQIATFQRFIKDPAETRLVTLGDGAAAVCPSAGPPEEPTSSVDVDPALVFWTSGSTGARRGVVLQHHAVIANIQSNIRALDLRSDDRTLVVLPLDHAYALVSQALCHLAIGATIQLPTSPCIGPLLVGALASFRSTTLCCAPPVAAALASALMNSARQLSDLRLITIGTAQANSAVVAQLHEALPWVTIALTYGLTQAGPRVSTRLLQAGCSDTNSVGVANPNVEVISDDRHEIAVRGRCCLRNYADEPFDEGADATIRTGDRGAVLPDGLHLHGRLDRQINRGGVLVSPERIESVLMSHQYISRAQVVPENHALLGSVPVAKVVVAEGGSEHLLAELQQTVEANLEVCERPARIDIVSEDAISDRKAKYMMDVAE
jgi:acyl-CoA synthetase (AMP-forming)/AMP-acid ligase II